MNTILIVEDDNSLRKGLDFDLRAEGYHTFTAENGKRALEILEKHNVNCILLDVNLPDVGGVKEYGDGFLLCQKIKKNWDVPVIFLTARDLEEDEMQGFEHGADDYITKPFSMPIVHKRIGAVLKRYGKKEMIYTDDFLYIDFDNVMASVNGESIQFTPTEYKILRVFIANAGNVLTRGVLLDKLWDAEGNFVDEHALTVNINRIRNKIEDASHKYIKTIYGIGYSWVGEKI